MANMTGRPQQNSGIPLGGIGAGTVELRPDGEFHEWQISNQERWAKPCGGGDADNGSKLTGALSFYLRTEEEGAAEPVRLRRLGLGVGVQDGREEYNYRMYSRTKPVREVEFSGQFPAAKLSYIDDDLPVKATLEALSPFTAHDHETAGTPGFYLTFRLTNTSAKPVTAALAGKLKNIVCRGQAGKTVNEIIQNGDVTALHIRASEDAEPTADAGGIALSVCGGEASWVGGDYAAYMSEYVAYSEFGVSEESFLFDLRRSGKLPNTAPACEPLNAEYDEDFEDLSDTQLDALLALFRQNAYALAIQDRILSVKPELCDTREGKIELLEAFRAVRAQLNRNIDETRRPWGDGALCASVTLAPGESREIRFTLAWFFPNHYSENGALLGHWYENKFESAMEVSRFLMANADAVCGKARLFVQNLYDSSAPAVFADAWSGQLATLIKCSWWLKDGNFGIWEGLGSCGFHTTDITFHGSFGIVSLFPALQKRQMRMGAAFQRADGRVHHFFTPDLSSVDNGFDRVDMNPQFVLLICRDYLFTGDLDYLRDLWPNIEHAMDNIALLDSDGDGLPDTETKRNTYDSWNFSGMPSYISILWLAALKAAAVLAQTLEKREQAQKWAEMLAKGSDALEKRLWNGEYYDLWVDGEKRDVCCMTGQLDGEWFARAAGIGGILPQDRMQKALDAIFRVNFSGEGGLVNASYPPGAAGRTLHTYRNCQAEANWTGVEYAVAALCHETGFAQNAHAIVRSVDERHRRLGQTWNHAECGEHYYRPLSSWSLLSAVGGLRYSAAAKTLSLDAETLADACHHPWVTSSAFGQIVSDGKTAEIRCLSGSLAIDCVKIGERVQEMKTVLQAGQVLAVSLR